MRLPQTKLGSRSLFQAIGLGFASLLGKGRNNKDVSPHIAERMRFEKDVRDQFVKLKEKGLSISVFTL